MKQFLLMILVTVGGSVASLVEPFWGILLYYWLAVLRPQYMWNWALPVELRWSLIAAVVVVLSVVLNLDRVVDRTRINLISVLIVVYAVLLGVSVITAYDTVTAQIWGIEYYKILLMALIATMVIQHAWQVKAIALMVALMLGYVGWEMNMLYLVDGRLDIFHHGYGNLDNNGAGLLMSIGIMFAYCFAVTSRHIWQRAFFWFLGVLMLHAMLMSYSRGAMLAAIVGAVWLLIHHRPRLKAGMIAIVLCFVVSVLAGKEIRERFMSMTDHETDYSGQSRLASWQAGWKLSWDRPLVGQGIRNSNQYMYYYGADKAGRTIHNQYLQIAADSGIPAACVYLVILGLAVHNLRRSQLKCERFLRQDDQHKLYEITEHQLDEIDQYRNIALGIQGGLITFCFGAFFLSIEIVELPWLIITVAGLMPGLIEKHIDSMIPLEFRETSAAVEPLRPTGYLPRRRLDAIPTS